MVKVESMTNKMNMRIREWVEAGIVPPLNELRGDKRVGRPRKVVVKSSLREGDDIR